MDIQSYEHGDVWILRHIDILRENFSHKETKTKTKTHALYLKSASHISTLCLQFQTFVEIFSECNGISVVSHLGDGGGSDSLLGGDGI